MELPGQHVEINRARGFTLIEMVLAMAILAVAVSALVVLIPFATQQNALNRWDTAGMVYAQRVLEQMRAQGPTPGSFTLCDTSMSTAATCPVTGETQLTINMAAGGCPLTTNGSIDWTQPVSSCVPSDTATLKESSNPQAPDILVRWNIQVATNGGKLVTISGRKTLSDVLAGRGTIVPANLQLFMSK